MIECAIALTLLMTLAFGALEYGLHTQRKLQVTASVNAAIRAAAFAGNDMTADYEALQALNNGNGSEFARSISSIVIFKANSPGGSPSTQCANVSAQAGMCNVYSGNDIYLSENELAATGRSNTWPPSSRLTGSDYVGIAVVGHYGRLTTMFGSDELRVNDAGVMRIDPESYEAWVAPPTTLPAPTVPPSTTTTAPTTTTTRPTTTTTRAATTTTTPPNGPTTTRPPSTTTTTRPTTTTSTTRPPTTLPNF